MSPDVNSNILLGRIRFLNKCIECFRKSEHLPESLCYVPKEVCYKICKDSSSGSVSASSSTAGNSGGKSVVSVRESPHQAPHKKSCKCNIEPKKSTCIRTTGEEYCNGHGLWVKISKVTLEHLYELLGVAWNWCQVSDVILIDLLYQYWYQHTRGFLVHDVTACNLLVWLPESSTLQLNGHSNESQPVLFVPLIVWVLCPSQEQLEEYCAGLDIEEGWILVCKHTEGGDRLVPVESPETISRQQQLFGYDHKPCSRFVNFYMSNILSFPDPCKLTLWIFKLWAQFFYNQKYIYLFKDNWLYLY